MTGSAASDSGLPPRYPFRADWEVTPRALAAELAGGAKPLLIDCRTAQEHATARIGGAILIPMNEVSALLDVLGEALDRRVVVHCHHGQRSLRVVAYLRQQGFTDVWSLAGGIDAWSVGVDSSVPRY